MFSPYPPLPRCLWASQPESDPWLLADDGLVDQRAIHVAANGYRPVRLTHRERRYAAHRILQKHGTLLTVYHRLAMPSMRATLALNWECKYHRRLVESYLHIHAA